MRNLIATFGMVSALGAQAQPPQAPECDEAARKTYSAVNGLIACGPAEAVGQPYTLQSTQRAMPAVSAGDIQFGLTGVTDSRYGNGIEITASIGTNNLATGAMFQQLRDAQQVLAALSAKLGDNSVVSVGAGARSESARVGFDDTSLDAVNLSAQNMFIRIDTKFLKGSLGLDKAAITYIHTQAKDQALKSETRNWTEESVIDMGSFTRYLTEYYSQASTTRFRGLDTQKLLAHAVFYVGANGEVTLQLGVMHREGHGTTGAVGVTGNYYTSIAGVPLVLTGAAGKNISGSQNHQSVGARWALSEHWTAGLERSRFGSGLGDSRYDTRATIMYNSTSNTPQFNRPNASKALDPRSIVSEILRNPEFRIGPIAGQGVIDTQVDTIKTGEQIVDITKPEPLVDAPTTITLDATDITTTSILAQCGISDADGATGTCTIRNAISGEIFDTWSIGAAARAITGLKSDTPYTLTLEGTANNGANGTVTPINEIRNFKTAAIVPPTITLNGASSVTLTVGDTWLDPGITCDEPCTTIIGGSVNTNVAGTYTLFYQGQDAAGNMSPVITRTVEVQAAADPAPIVGGAFESLGDMEISDQAGLGPILPINAGGVTDTLNRTIVYSATGLPSGLSIDSSTGVISGIYDASPTTAFSVTVKAQATGSTQSATKQFTLTISNDG